MTQLVDLLGLPSWCNQAGRVDRSACLEIKASDVARLVGRDGSGWVDAPSAAGRVRTAVVTLDIYDLRGWAKLRPAVMLAGDRRGPRANAMCDEGVRVPRVGEKLEPGEYVNPNHGRWASKWLGLAISWTQTIRLEQWRLHPDQGLHTYLVCPCGGRLPLPTAARGPTGQDVAGLSTRERGHAAWGCPQRVNKLLLVRCTQKELRAMIAAERWIHQLSARDWPRELGRVKLVRERLGMLMGLRTAVCRRCLGVRYGNDPAVVRAAARRQRERRRRRGR